MRTFTAYGIEGLSLSFSMKSIVVASVLKPVNDTRLYAKIGRSLARHFSSFHIHIVAFQSSSETVSTEKNITFHPIFNFSRLHPKRILANFLFLNKLRKLRPVVIVVATFELLPAVVLYKLFFNTKLVYDVQENYYKNICYTKAFASILRRFLAVGVRTLERVSHPFISLYLLAESCYVREMSFLKNKSYTVENKFVAPVSVLPPKTHRQLVYSGTISEDYGIFQAIDFAKYLFKRDETLQLTIVGYCAIEKERIRLGEIAKNIPQINLIGIDTLVPHEKILEYIFQAAFVLMPYQVNKSVENRIPTKFYECLALQTPMIIQENKVWEDFLHKFPFQSAFFIDYQKVESYKAYYEQMQKTAFYENVDSIKGIYWKEEEQKLISAFERLLY